MSKAEFHALLGHNGLCNTGNSSAALGEMDLPAGDVQRGHTPTLPRHAPPRCGLISPNLSVRHCEARLGAIRAGTNSVSLSEPSQTHDFHSLTMVCKHPASQPFKGAWACEGHLRSSSPFPSCLWLTSPRHNAEQVYHALPLSSARAIKLNPLDCQGFNETSHTVANSPTLSRSVCRGDGIISTAPIIKEERSFLKVRDLMRRLHHRNAPH